MVGETNLQNLLASMEPRLIDGEYVFSSLKDASYGDYSELSPIATMMESEGLTVVMPKGKADEHNIAYEAVFCCITLEVHSSLEAVGLTAAFAAKLTEHGISANVIAGYYHDHIFVQASMKDQALSALQELTG